MISNFIRKADKLSEDVKVSAKNKSIIGGIITIMTYLAVACFSVFKIKSFSEFNVQNFFITNTETGTDLYKPLDFWGTDMVPIVSTKQKFKNLPDFPLYYIEAELYYHEKYALKKRKDLWTQFVIKSRMVPCDQLTAAEITDAYGVTDHNLPANMLCINRTHVELLRAFYDIQLRKENKIVDSDLNPLSVRINVWPCDPNLSEHCKLMNESLRNDLLPYSNLAVVHFPFKTNFADKNPIHLDTKDKMLTIQVSFYPELHGVTIYSGSPQRVDVIDDYGFPFGISKT